MRKRVPILISLLVTVPVGMLLKFYDGPQRWWVNNWLASVAYEVFWMLCVFLIVPRRGWVTGIAVGVCVATCGLEFLQLWHPRTLEIARATFVGNSVLGHAFSWWDLPAYPLGCGVGYLLLRWLMRYQ